MGLWAEVYGTVRVVFLYWRATVLRRRGRTAEARRTVLRCAALIHEPGEANRGALVSFVPKLLAELSDGETVCVLSRADLDLYLNRTGTP